MPAGPTGWLLEQALLPEDYLWFIWALAVMTVVTRLLRSWPWLLGAVAVAMVLSPVHPDLGRQTVPFFTYAPFFVVGFLLAPALQVRRRTLVVAGVVSAACFLPLAVLHTEVELVLTSARLDGVLLTLVGLPAVALLGLVLTRLPGARLWTLLGRRTLPIYVAHMPVLLIGSRVVREEVRPWAEPRAELVLAILVVLAVGLSLLLKAVSDRLPFDGILSEPRWVRSLLRAR